MKNVIRSWMQFLLDKIDIRIIFQGNGKQSGCGGVLLNAFLEAQTCYLISTQTIPPLIPIT